MESIYEQYKKMMLDIYNEVKKTGNTNIGIDKDRIKLSITIKTDKTDEAYIEKLRNALKYFGKDITKSRFSNFVVRLTFYSKVRKKMKNCLSVYIGEEKEKSQDDSSQEEVLLKKSPLEGLIIQFFPDGTMNVYHSSADNYFEYDSYSYEYEDWGTKTGNCINRNEMGRFVKKYACNVTSVKVEDLFNSNAGAETPEEKNILAEMPKEKQDLFKALFCDATNTINQLLEATTRQQNGEER